MKKLILALVTLSALPAIASELTLDQAEFHFGEYFAVTPLCQAGNPGQDYVYDFFCDGGFADEIQLIDNQYVIEYQGDYGLTTVYTLMDNGEVEVTETEI